MKLKTVCPSSSYHVKLPADIRDDADGRVSSFWVQGKPLLLQLSSYLRESGPQTGASHRLNERMLKHPARWKIWDKKINLDPSVDEATAEFTDDSGTVWVHSYFVWSHLTVYATISGPLEVVGNPDNWAILALQELTLTKH